jgi:outer membrane protein assembly factor BamB
VRTFDLAGANAAIGALAATADGMIATAANGSLHVLEPDGATRWSRDGVGDAVGAPAAAGGTIAFAERGGSVHLFTAASGEPLTDIDLPAAPPHGLATDGSLFFAACADGTAWCYDPTRGVVVLQARIDDRARFRPAPFGGDRVAFGGRGARLEFVRTPRAPAAPR